LPGVTLAKSTPVTEPPGTHPETLAPQADKPTENDADSTDQRARTEARDRFATGLKLYEDGEFALALIEFDRAYQLVPDHRVLFNIGQVNIQLGRYARAVRSLRQYLSEGKDRVPEDRKQSVLNDLSMLAARTATILVLVNVTDAEVLLDNDIVAVTPMTAPLLVDAGEHRLTVRKPGYVSRVKPLALAGRDEAKIEVSLVAEPKHVSTEKTVIVERKTVPQVDRSDPRNLYLLLGWSAVGLMGAGWATTGYLGYQSAQDRKDALDTKTSEASLNHLESKTRHWYLASDVLGVTTILATGSMLYYTFAAPNPARKPEQKVPTKTSFSLDASPHQITLSGSF
jgi:tetratricopeptide (TPR) repeat protein